MHEVDKLEAEVQTLKSKLEEFERNCCNKSSIEKDAREALLLEQLLRKIDSIIARQDKHEKILYLATGGFMLFEYLGLGHKLTALIP